MSSLKDLAIQYALENKWQDARDTNLKLLNDIPSDVDTLNRLAFAYVKLSDFAAAKKTYDKVIALDKTNPIALKNLRKIDTLSTNGKKVSSTTHESSTTTNSGVGFDTRYIEEAGKTKTLDLKNIADKKTISQLQAGEMAVLITKRSKIFIQTQGNTYIGMLPDNVGMRLVSLIKGGNEYSVCIKSVSEKSVTVFVREVKQSPKFKNQPSFISTGHHSSK